MSKKVENVMSPSQKEDALTRIFYTLTGLLENINNNLSENEYLIVNN